jgi:CheY-like chemotaxis protein
MNERILIVEGSAVRGQAMSLLLSDLGNYVTTYARTILEAFTQLKQNSFDMVITNTDVERQGDGVKLLQVLLLRGLVA